MTTKASTEPYTGKVLFIVNVRAFQHDDHWTARALETGIIGYGADEAEARKAVNDASESIVSRWKLRGRAELEKYLVTHGIEFSLDSEWGPEPRVGSEKLAA